MKDSNIIILVWALIINMLGWFTPVLFIIYNFITNTFISIWGLYIMGILFCISMVLFLIYLVITLKKTWFFNR